MWLIDVTLRYYEVSRDNQTESKLMLENVTAAIVLLIVNAKIFRDLEDLLVQYIFDCTEFDASLHISFVIVLHRQSLEFELRALPLIQYSLVVYILNSRAYILGPCWHWLTCVLVLFGNQSQAIKQG